MPVSIDLHKYIKQHSLGLDQYRASTRYPMLSATVLPIPILTLTQLYYE